MVARYSNKLDCKVVDKDGGTIVSITPAYASNRISTKLIQCRFDRGIGGAGDGTTRDQHAASHPANGSRADGCPQGYADRDRGQLSPISKRWPGGGVAPKDTPPDVIASMAKSVKEILSEPAVATQLQETQQMTLLLADGKSFRRSSPSRSASGARSSARIISRRSGATPGPACGGSRRKTAPAGFRNQISGSVLDRGT